MRAIGHNQITEEIVTLANELGKRPIQRQWEVRFKHAASVLGKYGGWTTVCDNALIDWSPAFEMADIPPEERTAEELIEAKKLAFKRLSKHHKATKLTPVKVNIDGPVGIAFFGDPHIDADGCDIALLEEHLRIVRETPGMTAANVGDTTNNWTGRLARLHAEQGTTGAESWVLAEWLFNSCDWLFAIGGNHDLWSGHGDPLKWIASQASVPYGPSAVRVALRFPNKREIRVNARHDFPGHSMYNNAHGVGKAAKFGWRDHVLTCGHKHKSGYIPLKDPMSGLISHAIQVASYKTLDHYARDRGYADENISPCVAVVIDPAADRETQLITFFLDVEEASGYLNWKRGRKAA